ncbi:hypothetical protein D3C87_1299690 [compost metagenome]
MAAREPGLGDDRELGAANAECGPVRTLRQHTAGVEDGLRARGESVLHAQHEGPQAGAVQHPLAHEIERHVQVTGIEDLQLRHHACAADDACHLAHVGGRIDDNVAARVHRIQIEGTDIGSQRRDMFHPLERMQ